jgi:polyribonucleotide nucleotidyltransferase
MYKKVATIINGQEFSIETGKIAKQASGAAWVTFGQSVVSVTAVADNNTRDGIDFVPLTVDYQEFAYAAGKVPGNYFRREMGRPSENETLTSRLIDRPLRPNIGKGWTYETQVIANVFSIDRINDTDVMALTGASAALCLSDIPFNGPLAGVRVGRIDGKLIINPTFAQREDSDIDIIVAGSRQAVVMVEGGCDNLSEDEVLEAIWFGHHNLIPLLNIQEELMNICGKPKRAAADTPLNNDFINKIAPVVASALQEALNTKDKLVRYEKVRQAKLLAVDTMGEEYADKSDIVKAAVDELQSQKMREDILSIGRRVDGRDLTTVRPISVETGLLPRAHGSALFTRGETQSIVTATLGTGGDEQRIESFSAGDYTRHFMLHYNFPPYSVNEVKRLSGPGRREIGHGALARRAIEKILPSKEDFPYTIRVVSEITESNGSSSMATVCGSSLSLMDAGVPVKAAVAGVAMGLIMEDERIAVLTDILGDEDHLGDMDFKVAGTATGITAVQMDIKISGITKDIMNQALLQARTARLHILAEMSKAIAKPKGQISDFAPKITTIKISIEKIKDIIGPGGKIIRGIQMETGVKIDVEDDGTVHIAAVDTNSADRAIKMIRELTQEVEEGAVYDGKVVKLMDFGAFVEIMPGRDGLIHISEIDHTRVRTVSDVLKEGDIVKVKVLGVDDRGKVRLSRKAMLPLPEEIKHPDV